MSIESPVHEEGATGVGPPLALLEEQGHEGEVCKVTSANIRAPSRQVSVRQINIRTVEIEVGFKTERQQAGLPVTRVVGIYAHPGHLAG